LIRKNSQLNDSEQEVVFSVSPQGYSYKCEQYYWSCWCVSDHCVGYC